MFSISVILCLLCGVSLAVQENSEGNAPSRKTFHVSAETGSWFQAMINCKAADMELATISSEQDQAKLIGDIWNHVNITTGENIWLGGTNLNTGSRQYYWVDGTPVIYSNWGLNKPDTSASNMCMYTFLGVNHAEWNENWYNWSCAEALFRYVCQIKE